MNIIRAFEIPAGYSKLMASLFLTSAAPASSTISLDGGMGTWLAERGNDVTGVLWSAQILLDNPNEVQATHQDFYDAGAQVATTCSYEVTYDGLAALGYDAESVDEVLRTSVRLAQQARDLAQPNSTRPLYVAASVGPYGAGPGAGTEYDGAYGLSADELAQWHHRRLSVLDATGADVLLCETIPSLLEVTALVSELAQLKTPALLSINVQPRAGAALDPVLADGSELAEVAALVKQCPQIKALGVNCCSAPLALAAIQKLHQFLELPLMVYPNSGETWDHAQRIWHEATTENLSIIDRVPEFLANGVRYIGGCCRVTPQEIQQIVAALPR